MMKHKCLEMIRILIKLIQIVLRKFVFLLNRQNYFDSQFAALYFDAQNQQLLDCICWLYMSFPCFLLFRMFALIRDSFVYVLFLILCIIRGC